MFANAQGGDPHHNTLRKMCVTVNKPHIKTDQPPMPSGKSFNLGQDADKAEIWYNPLTCRKTWPYYSASAVRRELCREGTL